MLKKYWPLRFPDENHGGTPSTPAAPAAHAESIASVAKKAFEESSSQLEAEPEGDVQELDKTPENPEVATPESEPTHEETPQEETPETPSEEPTEEAPETPPEDKEKQFDNHPRFKQLIKERDEAKADQAKLKEYEPLVNAWAQHMSFIQDNAIPQEEVNLVMNFLAAKQTDPVRARELLKPLWDTLAVYDPETIPQDLADRVKAGEMSAAVAKELAVHRAKAAGIQQREQASTRQQQQRAVQQVVQALTQWDGNQRRNTPGFKPKVNGGPDGLYELTAKGYAYLAKMRPPQTPQEAIVLVETAFADAKKVITQGKPAGVVKPPLTSKNSSGKPKTEPQNIRDVVRQTAAAHGIRTRL